MTDHLLRSTRIDAAIGTIITGSCTACPWMATCLWPDPGVALGVVEDAHRAAHEARQRHPVVTAAVSDRQCDGCATPHDVERFPEAGEGVHLCVDCRLAELAKMLAASGEKP